MAKRITGNVDGVDSVERAVPLPATVVDVGTVLIAQEHAATADDYAVVALVELLGEGLVKPAPTADAASIRWARGHSRRPFW
ncbi:hypothetical protein [uncultured Cohaesibacter sp.]|uniref:hypothetical protein n=1 Tax=uncultured Cohaesibacter sp. TaxID=1002546 RepID=UPI0029C7BB4E|nr:hypothetical protein [uncultured Cohaesibacter sp.]